MKVRILLGLCFSTVALFSNDKIINKDVMYSQVTNTKESGGNVIIKSGKDNQITDNLFVTLDNASGQFDIKIKDKDYNLTLNKSIELCKEENGEQIDKTPIGYSILNTRQVIDFLEKERDLKSGHEINLGLCKTNNHENGYYYNLILNTYSITTFPMKKQ